MYAQDSIELLQNSGLQFKKHEEEGIDPMDFAELYSFLSGSDFSFQIELLASATKNLKSSCGYAP